MGTINHDWYDRNAGRDYPLADAATCRATAGDRLPQDVLVDAVLRYPAALGDAPHVAAVAVTATLVSVTFQCAPAADSDDGFTPLAVVSLPRPVVPGRHYPLQAQAPGVGGWVVFGPGIDRPFTGRFSVAAGLLSPRAARPYRPAPVTSLGKLHHVAALTGLVRLTAVDPLEIVRETVEIDGVARDAAVIRLVQPAGTASVVTQEGDVFSRFAGPCGKRPESGTCGDPAPIEFINAVPPDCDGTVTVRLSGCARIARVEGTSGIVIDCGLGLSAACLPTVLPAADGRLRTDYLDECGPYGPGTSETSDSAPAGSDSAGGGASDSVSVVGILPYDETFNDGVADDWLVLAGDWDFAPDGSPADPGGLSYTTENDGISGRNLAVWAGFDASTLGRRYVTEVKLVGAVPAVKHNAGLVINYRPSLLAPSQHVYFLAEVDVEAQQFRIRFFNGTALVATAAYADLTNLQPDRWYRITVTTAPGTGTQVTLAALLESLEGPALTASLSLTTNTFLPETGRAGFHTDRAAARFARLRVEEA